MKKMIILIFMLDVCICFAQTDLVKWRAKTISYELGQKQNVTSNSPGNFGAKLASAVQTVYKTLFSNLDGDNCPFYPSCSNFYVQAIDETNIFKGTLMFADRFTRDINFFKGTEHYPSLSSGKFFDPPYNYKLNTKDIIIPIPSTYSN